MEFECDMVLQNATKYRFYRLPPQFWVDFEYVRNCMFEEPAFRTKVVSPFHQYTELYRAWWRLTTWFDPIHAKEVKAGRM